MITFVKLTVGVETTLLQKLLKNLKKFKKIALLSLLLT